MDASLDLRVDPNGAAGRSRSVVRGRNTTRARTGKKAGFPPERPRKRAETEEGDGPPPKATVRMRKIPLLHPMYFSWRKRNGASREK